MDNIKRYYEESYIIYIDCTRKVEIHLLFLYSFLRRWCQKAYINTGTFRKGISIDFGTVYQSFFCSFKKYTFQD